MKPLQFNWKILLVMAVCIPLMMPAAASALEQPNVLLSGGQYLPGKPASASFELGTQGETKRIEFYLVNGDGLGNDVVSSVKVAVLDESGKVKEVVFEPRNFSQKKGPSSAIGTLSLEALDGMSDLNLSIHVGGPKNSSIKLTVTEYYEEEDSVWPDWLRW